MIQSLVNRLLSLAGNQISKDSSAVLVSKEFANVSRNFVPSFKQYHVPIMSLNVDGKSLEALSLYEPKGLIFLSLNPVLEIIEVMKFILSKCLKVTSIFVLSNTLPDKSFDEEKFLMDQLKEILGPVKVSVVYLPLHSQPILSSDSLEVRTLCSAVSDAFPLTLYRLDDPLRLRFNNASEIGADSLPTLERNLFKRLAYEIALSMVFELGLDVKDSLFALGATSKLIGSSVLSNASSLQDLHSKLLVHQGPSRIRDGASLLSDSLSDIGSRLCCPKIAENQPLKTASLILIDR
jgi:hypothetical protein